MRNMQIRHQIAGVEYGDMKIRERGTTERQHNFHSKKYCNCKMHSNVEKNVINVRG